LSSEPSSTTSHRATAARIAFVPFVVVRISVFAFGGRRGSDVEPVDHLGVALAADDGVVTKLRAKRAGIGDLGAAEHPLVPGCEGLGDRRRRPNDVDDDADGGGRVLLWDESDMDVHADTLARWTPRATATDIRTARRVCRAPSANVPSVTSA
jgi:hypothetical protein